MLWAHCLEMMMSLIMFICIMHNCRCWLLIRFWDVAVIANDSTSQEWWLNQLSNLNQAWWICQVIFFVGCGKGKFRILMHMNQQIQLSISIRINGLLIPDPLYCIMKSNAYTDEQCHAHTMISTNIILT